MLKVAERNCQFRTTAQDSDWGSEEGKRLHRIRVLHRIEHHKVVNTIPLCISNCLCLIRPLSMLNSRLVVTDQTGTFILSN